MKLPDIEELQKIYHAMQDDISREIYKRRLLYSLFHENREIWEIIKSWSALKVDFHAVRPCFYGAGEGGRILLQCSGIKVPFVIDSYRTGYLEGCPIISPDDFLKLPDHKEYLVIIAVGQASARREIEDLLDKHGIQYAEAYPDGQYFDLPELHLRNEYFVDAGAFDGETTEYFLDNFEGGYSYAFEANPGLVPGIKKRLGNRGNVEIFPCGLYDSDGMIPFASDVTMPSSSRITETGAEEIEVHRLDTLLGDRKVTYIKMDIEGSELAALRGAERIIREQRPKLAISVYHKPEDMWEIPSLILQYHPDYKLYLRHYSLYNTETVLYAI